MRTDPNYQKALEQLRTLLQRLKPGDRAFDEIVSPRDEVLARYGRIFGPEHVSELTVHDYRSFLYFKNNHHWSGLYRTGLAAKEDMPALRRAITLLVDESKPIATRLNEALSMVRGLGKAIATPILMVVYLTKYGVWNETSERGMKLLNIWPADLPSDKGLRYETINAVLRELSSDLRVDLWTLDALWWLLRNEGQDGGPGEPQEDLRNLFQEVLELQSHWSSSNTPEMRQRGQLIRNRIPSLLRPMLKHIPDIGEMEVEGRDGTGLKTRVPWVRVYNRELSPSATQGWYAVYLIAADGSAVYLSINQGTTTATDGQFVPRDAGFLAARVQAARTRLQERLAQLPAETAIMLRDPGGLGDGYERGNVYSIGYSKDKIPNPTALAEDLAQVLEALTTLYNAENVPTTSAFLLVWNPDRFTWVTLADDARAVQAREKAAEIRWSTKSGEVRPGDRLFLSRVGKEPKGIVGSAVAISEPYTAPHHSGESGKEAQYIDLKWDALLDPERQPPLPLSTLREVDPEYIWTPQASGLRIPEETAARLEAAWAAHLAGVAPDSTVHAGANVNFETIHTAFAEALQEANLDFGSSHEEVTRSFLASLATKRFVILTGLSGSGKTQIALKFGEWLGPDNHLLVPVRPDWTGAEALFGYEDALAPVVDKRPAWHVDRSLKFMIRAARNPRDPYALILDEMNLAHVERYFADALSGMESAQEMLPNLVQEKDGYWRIPPGEESHLVFPKNLFVIGTVNVDETTYLFSPKVLDRANTFEFRVRTEDLTEEARKPGVCVPGDPRMGAALLRIAQDDTWQVNHPHPDLGAFTTRLRDLHRILAQAGFEFGHRVFYEAIRFAAMLNAAGEVSFLKALDLQVLQKLLPRLHGSRRKLEATLIDVAHFCYDLTIATSSSDGTARFDPTAAPPMVAQLPRSFEKLRRMTQAVRANQFTSFTE